MSIENLTLNSNQNDEDAERKTSSKRLMNAIEAGLKFSVSEVSVEGEEYINQIPEGKKVIIVTTHISDIDVPIVASVLGKYFDIAITNQSIHHSFLGEPETNIGMRLAGTNNFIPIDYHKDNKEKVADFNPENFEPMVEALNEGKAVILAGHNPVKDWKLPKGGYGAVYLADICEDAVILPVAVDLSSEKPVGMHQSMLKTVTNRPSAAVSIGRAIELEKISNARDLLDIFKKRKNGEKVTKHDLSRLSEMKQLLRDQSDRIMKVLAEKLPNNKRGEYGEKQE